MMSRPEDNMFQEMLGDYMTPAKDDGFTASVMKQAEQQAAREKRYRRIAINVAALTGGLIAGVQLPKLGRLMGDWGFTAPTPDLSAIDIAALSSGLPQNMMPLAGALIISLALWAMLDQRGAAVF